MATTLTETLEDISAVIPRLTTGTVWANIPGMALIETDKDARRLARAMASDLSLYNEERIDAALQADDLFEALASEIQEARDYYLSRIAESLHDKNFFDRALVDVLVRSNGHIDSPIW